MVSVRRTLIIVLLFFGALLVSPVNPASAAACNSPSSQTVTGGYAATAWCSSVGYVTGYGSDLTDANLEMLELYQLFLDSGIDCYGTSVARATGGYSVDLFCTDGLLYVTGFGTTLTDAAVEARKLVELYVETGRKCDGRSARTVSGGYEVTLWCLGLLYVEGRGSTLTGAARVARLNAGLG